MTSCLALFARNCHGETKATPVGRIVKVTHQRQHRGRSLISTIALFVVVAVVVDAAAAVFVIT